MVRLRVTKQNWFGKTWGLIGKKEPKAILFSTRYGIHTLGLRFPIDLVVLDRENTVGFLKTNVKPNTLVMWPPQYDVVIELPKGTIEEKEIKLGEKIHLELSNS